MWGKTERNRERWGKLLEQAVNSSTSSIVKDGISQSDALMSVATPFHQNWIQWTKSES